MRHSFIPTRHFIHIIIGWVEKMRLATRLVLFGDETKAQQSKDRGAFGVNSACCCCTSLPNSTNTSPISAHSNSIASNKSARQSTGTDCPSSEIAETIELSDLSHLTPPSPAHSRASHSPSPPPHLPLSQAQRDEPSWPNLPTPLPRARTRL